MKKSSFALYYFGLGVIFIILEKYFELYLIETVVKGLILLVLMGFYHFSVKSRYNNFHRLIMAGLFFSMTGDILLQLSNGNLYIPVHGEYFFLMSMGAFLLAMIFYIVAFNIPGGENSIFRKRIYQFLLVLLYGSLLLWLLYNNLQGEVLNFRVPVIVLSVFVVIMLLSAMNRYGKVNGVSYMLVVIGSLLFVVSASMAVINQFLEKFDFARMLIMITYLAAQYLIALGSIKQDFPKKD